MPARVNRNIIYLVVLSVAIAGALFWQGFSATPAALSRAADVGLRGLFFFLSLLALTRLMGKKQVSQLSFFEYTAGIGIGTIAGSLSIDTTIDAVNGWIALLMWAFGLILLSTISVYSRTFRRFADGQPTLVIRNGKILEGNLERLNYNMDELRMQLRRANAFNLADVEFAILEADGNLSVLKKSQRLPVTAADLRVPTAYKGLPIELITDGHVLEEKMQQFGLTREWLTAEVQRRGYEIEDIYYAEIDTDGNLYVDLRDNLT